MLAAPPAPEAEGIPYRPRTDREVVKAANVLFRQATLLGVETACRSGTWPLLSEVVLSIHEKEKPMARVRRRHAISICCLILLAVLSIVPDLSFAQSGSVPIPEHAREKRFGGGWECDRGYRESVGGCVAIRLPENAYLTNTSYGRGWECERNYQETDGVCVAIHVPAHAYLDSSGARWKCDRGYQEVGRTCVAVQVPPNAFLADTSYGPGWKCDRGYRAADAACVAVKIPEKAHLDYSGHDWECNRPLQKRQDQCVLP